MSDFSFSTPAPSATQSLNSLGKRFRNPPQARWAMWLRRFGPHVAALCAEAMRCRAFRATSARPQARPYAQTLHAASRRRSNFRLQTKCARVHGVARGRIMQTLARLRFLLLAFRLASQFSLSAIARNRRPCFRGRTAALLGQLQPCRPCTSQAPGCRAS